MALQMRVFAFDMHEMLVGLVFIEYKIIVANID